MEEFLTQASVVSSGKTWLEIVLTRDTKGLEIKIQADPKVEEFMAGLAGTRVPKSLKDYGTNWYSPSGADIKIAITEKGLVQDGFTINVPHGDWDGDYGPNISILQLVGISAPGGVTFRVNGPYLDDSVRSIAAGIVKGARKLIKGYIVPVRITLRIMSQES